MPFLPRSLSAQAPRAWPVFVAFAIVCAATLTRNSAAQSLPSVGIYFEDTTGLWLKVDRPQIQATVRPKIAAFVQKAFPYWRFAEVEEANVPLALHFLITELQAGLISVAVELWERDHRVATWDGPFFRLADKLSSPPPTSDKVYAGFTALLKAKETDIKKNLGIVPIAVAAGGQWLPLSGPTDTPRVVLPLPWEKYQDLRESLLHLACATATDELATLEARGGTHADYRSAPDKQPYAALVIVPKRRLSPNEGEIDSHLYPEILRLSPRLVYLIEYAEPHVGDWDIATPLGGGQ